jgi:hypothetical protein
MTFFGLPTITSNAQEIAFQILNRTIWNNKKAFKSGKHPNPGCERCGRTETMEHLLCECEYYSEPLWEGLGAILTELFNTSSKSRSGENQHHLLHPSPLHPTTHIRQNNAKYSVALDTRSEEGHHLQENESASFSTTSL